MSHFRIQGTGLNVTSASEGFSLAAGVPILLGESPAGPPHPMIRSLSASLCWELIAQRTKGFKMGVASGLQSSEGGLAGGPSAKITEIMHTRLEENSSVVDPAEGTSEVSFA